MAFVPRRAQRVAYTSGLLLFGAAVLTAYSVQAPAIGRYLAGVVGGMMAPVQSLHQSVEAFLDTSLLRYRELSEAVELNQRLRQQVAVLQNQVTQLNEYHRENERLRGLLNMADSLTLQGPVARVIGMSSAGWSSIVTIDKGAGSGVVVGNPVVAAEGVVGRVIAVSENVAQVLPIIDPKSGADALLQQTRVRGVLEGGGSGGCSLRFVASRDVVTVGDVVVTSGFDGVFPPGLSLGRVTWVENGSKNLFQDIAVEPSADFSRIEQVMVVTATPPPAAQGPEQP